MRELMIKKCNSCGAMVKVINDCHCKCGFECCGEKMTDVKTNSTDGAVEKHVPTYERNNGVLEVSVNHVMDDDHYIEWICLLTDEKEEYVYFNPGEEATVTFEDVKKGTLYSYCNKHGLWKADL